MAFFQLLKVWRVWAGWLTLTNKAHSLASLVTFLQLSAIAHYNVFQNFYCLNIVLRYGIGGLEWDLSLGTV